MQRGRVSPFLTPTLCVPTYTHTPMCPQKQEKRELSQVACDPSVTATAQGGAGQRMAAAVQANVVGWAGRGLLGDTSCGGRGSEAEAGLHVLKGPACGRRLTGRLSLLLEQRFLLRFCLRKGTWTRVGAAVKHSCWQTKYLWGSTDRFSNQIWWQAVKRRSRKVLGIAPIQVPAVSWWGDRGAADQDRRPWRKWASGMLINEGPKHKRDA